MKDTIIRIWEKWFGFKTGQVTNITSKEPTSQPSVTKKETRLPSPMLQKLEDYLFETYNFRFNVLTEQTEYAPKGQN